MTPNNDNPVPGPRPPAPGPQISFNISEVAIRRPVTTVMLIMALIVLGLLSFRQLETDLFPNVEFPFVLVEIEYPGAAPLEIETAVTKPVEEAISAVNDIKHIYSHMYSGFSTTVIEFELGTDLPDVISQIREKLSFLRPRLPAEIHEPIILRFDPAAEPVVSYALSGPLPSVELTRLLKDRIQPALERVDGVGAVNLFGGTEREILVELLGDRLQIFGLTLPHVVDALRREGTDLPSGYVTEPRQELNLRVIKGFDHIPALAQLPMATLNGQVVRLKDLARVIDGFKERRSDGRMNGKEAVLFTVQKRSGANTVAMVDTIHAHIQEIEKTLPPGVHIGIGRDTARFVKEAIWATIDALIYGGILSALVIFVFLRSWRATMIAGLAIPISVIATFGPMKALSFSLNMMSLLSLALVVGILVDDAVVDLENIYRHIQEGKEPFRAAIDATNEIWLAVVATTFTIVAVFVPVAFMGGFIGQFFKQFGLTVTFAVLFSLLVARTLTPMLAARFLKVSGPETSDVGRRTSEEGAPSSDVRSSDLPTIPGVRSSDLLLHAQPGFPPLSLSRLERMGYRWRERYIQALHWALDHRMLTLGIAVLAFLASLPLAGLLPKGFMSQADRGELTIQVKMAPGTTLQETSRVVYEIERRVRRHREVLTTFATAGKRDGSTDAGGIGIRLVPRSQRKLTSDQLKTLLREEVKDIPGSQIGFIDIGLVGGEESDESRPVKLQLYGDNLEELNRYADKIAERMKRIPRMLEIDTSTSGSKPELRIHVDRQRAGSLGVDSETLAMTVRTATIGLVPSHFQEGDREIDLRVRLNEQDRRNLEKLQHLPIMSRSGRLVPLSAMATLQITSGPTKMLRHDRKRAVSIWANTLPGTALGDAIQLVTQEIESLKLPPTLRFEFLGEAERMADAFDNMLLALGLSFVFIYIVLASQFESFVHPLTIMAALPLSFVGAFLAMFVANEIFGLMGLIGIVMLMGLVTKNAILLVDYALQMRRLGLERREALLRAGSVRLRPILMTTSAMIMGMLPIALRLGAASEFRAPMGIAVIGGLITSTLLTLIVVPVIYTLFDDLQGWLGSRLARL